MKKNHLYYLIFVLILLLIAVSLFKVDKFNNKNSNVGVLSTVWYQTAGEVQALYYQAYNLAEMQLVEQVENYSGEKKPAIVLDIDETVLNNSPHTAKLIQLDSLYPVEWDAWMKSASAKALPGAVAFTNRAAELGVEVFYISNRKEKYLEVTIKNMKAAGFPMADDAHILLRSSSSDKAARRAIVSQDCEILMLFGDNLSDFDSMFCDCTLEERNQLTTDQKEAFGVRFFILPNPLYGDWEGALLEGKEITTREEKATALKPFLQSF